MTTFASTPQISAYTKEQSYVQKRLEVYTRDMTKVTKILMRILQAAAVLKPFHKIY